MQVRSLCARIVIFFALLLAVAQLATFAIVNKLVSRNARAAIQHELEAGERVFRRLRDQNTLQLIQAVIILSSDFGFRSTIASRPGATIASALENQTARINASMIMLVALDGTVLADTLSSDSR